MPEMQYFLMNNLKAVLGMKIYKMENKYIRKLCVINLENKRINVLLI